ncbi:MAG: hypothetical protein IT245_05205 [Bacteroidia bacterium]|nr:hypothetical protein [Bacteroidia bacterium]
MKMKSKSTIIICLSALFLFACGGTKSTSSNNTDNVQEQVSNVNQLSSGIESLDEFLSDFESATLAHNSTTIFTFLDKDYKKEQWGILLKNNTDTFLCKFYSNNLTENNQPKIDYKKITRIVRKSFFMNSSYILVNYSIGQGNISVDLQLTVFSKLDKGVLRYSIYGPIG